MLRVIAHSFLNSIWSPMHSRFSWEHKLLCHVACTISSFSFFRSWFTSWFVFVVQRCDLSVSSVDPVVCPHHRSSFLGWNPSPISDRSYVVSCSLALPSSVDFRARLQVRLDTGKGSPSRNWDMSQMYRWSCVFSRNSAAHYYNFIITHELLRKRYFLSLSVSKSISQINLDFQDHENDQSSTTIVTPCVHLWQQSDIWFLSSQSSPYLTSSSANHLNTKYLRSSSSATCDLLCDDTNRPWQELERSPLRTLEVTWKCVTSNINRVH